MRFFVLKRKNILIVMLCVMLASLAVFVSYNLRFTSANVKTIGLTIVIDAGHGGRDGGAVGANGTIESEINLQIAKKLESYLKKANINVVMTRKSDEGLYDKFGRNYKMDDMTARQKIIEEADSDLVVSIHQNSYPQRSVYGASVFYYEHSEASKLAAEKVAGQISKIQDKNCNIKEGAFYILNCTKVPSIMIECGFLSNAEEEQKLKNSDYQEKLAYLIFCGILQHFEIVNY